MMLSSGLTIPIQREISKPSAVKAFPDALGTEVKKPLPALPLPTGSKIAFLGDSYVQRGGYSRMQLVSGSYVPAGGAVYGRGLWGQLASFDQRYKIEMFSGDARPYVTDPASDSLMTGSIHGLGGDRVNGVSADRPGFLGRLAACLSVAPAIIVVETPGGNNAGDGTDAETIIGYLNTLAKKIRNAGVYAVFVTMPFFVGGTYDFATIAAVNNWLRSQVAAGREGFYLADANALEGQGIIPQDTGWLTDGVHRGPQAACRVAREILHPVLATLVSPGSFIDKNPLANNLLPAKGLPGTTGTKSVSAGAVGDITGNVATRMELRRTAGTSKIACFKEVISTGDEFQVVTITPVNDGTLYHSLALRDNNNNGTAADLVLSSLGVDVNNDWGLEWIWQVELDGWDGWKVLPSNSSPAGFSVIAYDNVSFINTANSASYGAGVFVMRHLMRFRQAQGRIPTNLRIAKFGTPWTLMWRSDVSGTGVAKMRSPIIRRVTSSPMAAWNL